VSVAQFPRVSFIRILADEKDLNFSGLLLVSLTDFGYPNLVTLALAVEKPVDGVLKLATSVQYGEPEETEEQPETHQYGRPGKRNSQTPDDDYV
jgi:hypothetical protein